MTEELAGLPNIGKELAEKLFRAGIKSAAELHAAGSKETFIKLKTIYPEACINVLFAVEGAIQDVRWHNLDEVTKNELREFYNQTKKL